MTHKDRFHYVVSDYGATGEGRTISILITQPRFVDDDYKVKPFIDEDFRYYAGVLKDGHTEKVAIGRQFIEQFDGFFARGAENMPREKFIENYGKFVPDVVCPVTPK